MRVGVLALQGASSAHQRAFGALGVEAVAIRTPTQLDSVDRLVLPGGESTTISFLLESNGLFEPVAARLADGMPVLGTCAGLILLAREVVDGRPDQRSFGVIDIVARRNAFGRQVDSFETDLVISGMDGPAFPAVFIRAPVVEAVGPGVDVLARVDQGPVLCRQGSTLVSAFHPELSGDLRLHQLFCHM